MQVDFNSDLAHSGWNQYYNKKLYIIKSCVAPRDKLSLSGQGFGLFDDHFLPILPLPPHMTTPSWLSKD